jgi:hypothetical protein
MPNCFCDYLRSPGGGGLPDENIFCLLNEEAKAANFWVKGVSRLRSKQLKAEDRLYIYLAGHGDAINSDEYFFLTYDCNPAGDKNNYIVTGNIQLFNLKSRIAALTGSDVEVLLIMDACRTNELPGGAEGQRFLSTAVSEQSAGETVMLAAGAGQESIEDRHIGIGHGLFTYSLIEGLSGLADKQGNGMIRMLGRAIDLIGTEDSVLAKALLPKYYFYKALASTDVAKGDTFDISTARRFMSQAYSLDTRAAYIQLGFAYVYMQSQRYDSTAHYGTRAKHKAPRWATAYLHYQGLHPLFSASCCSAKKPAFGAPKLSQSPRLPMYAVKA